MLRDLIFRKSRLVAESLSDVKEIGSKRKKRRKMRPECHVLITG